MKILKFPLGSALGTRSCDPLREDCCIRCNGRVFCRGGGFCRFGCFIPLDTQRELEQEKVVVYVTRGSKKELKEWPSEVEGTEVIARVMGKMRGGPAMAWQTGGHFLRATMARIACGSFLRTEAGAKLLRYPWALF